MATNSMVDSIVNTPMADSMVNSIVNTPMADSVVDSIVNTPMADSMVNSIVNTPMADSSMANSEITNITNTAVATNTENEEDEYFKSAVQFEKQVNEPPVVQPKKSSKHSKYMCGICIKYFDKQTQLKTHLSRYHDGTDSNICTICGWLNTKEVDISDHIRSVHPWYRQCDQCQKWIRSKRRLNIHMLQFHAPATKRIQCQICSNSFIKQKTLATHMLKFHMLLQCLECHEFFSEDEDLDVHQRKCHSKAGCKRKQSKDPQHQINECLVTSTSQDNDDLGHDICSDQESLSETSLMDESVKSHNSEKVISDRSDKGIQSFQKLTSLRDRHLEVSLCLQDKVDTNESHSMDNIKKSKVEVSQSGLHCQSSKLNQAMDMISCKYCDLKLSCRASFSNHMILIHEACECECCNGWFEDEKILLDHLRICNRSKIRYRTSVKDSNLNECNSASPMCQAQQTAFEDPTEESIAPSFICTVCNMTFPTMESLSNHGNSCQRSFNCSICDEVLQDEAALLDHVQFVHRVGKNYNCSLCERLFLKASSLKRHLTTTHGYSKVKQQVIKLPKRKYMHRCCLCRKVFSQYSYLKMHLRLHVKQKQPKRGGRVSGRVVTEDINSCGVSYSCTDNSVKMPVETVTANCSKSWTVREELPPSFSTDNHMHEDQGEDLVGWDGSGRVKGRRECVEGVCLKNVDRVPNATAVCPEGSFLQMENCENIVHQNTEAQSMGDGLIDDGTNSAGLENSLNKSQVGNLPCQMNTMNTFGNGNRTYVSNPLGVEMTKNVNDTEADSAVDVNSIIASLVESLPVDQCPTDMETSNAVQSILEIPVIDQSHHLRHTEHAITTPSEHVNSSFGQRQGFMDEESRHKDNSEVCQQPETLSLDRLNEDSHVPKDHSYMMTRHPSNVPSECPSDLNTCDPSGVISKSPTDIISTEFCGFRTAGQSNSDIVMASNDRNEKSPIVISHEEIKGSDKENNICVNSSNCSDEKHNSVCSDDSSDTGEDNSVNNSDNSCDADCSEDNPSNSSSDKTRDSHSFDSLQESKDMDAEQELELPHIEIGARTSQSKSLDVPSSSRGRKLADKWSGKTKPCHHKAYVGSKGCCSLSCAALKERCGRRVVHYRCGVCHQIFKQFELLQQHKVAQHSLRCAACGLVCNRMIDLLTHYEFCDG